MRNGRWLVTRGFVVSVALGLWAQSSVGQNKGGGASDRSKEKEVIAAQKNCPVSGKSLGSMGAPIRTTVKDQDVYVCCRGCIARLQKEPDKYLANLRYNGARLAQNADEKAWKSQATCPVMESDLGEMGTLWVVRVRSRDVFVCCRGCIAKLQKDPAKYLAKLPPVKEAGRKGGE